MIKRKFRCYLGCAAMNVAVLYPECIIKNSRLCYTFICILRLEFLRHIIVGSVVGVMDYIQDFFNTKSM
jgi:hypothetical protein